MAAPVLCCAFRRDRAPAANCPEYVPLSTVLGMSTHEDPQAAGSLASPGLEVICGPMFAGKTTELLRRVREERGLGRLVGLVKSSVDKRYTCDQVTAHNGDSLPCVQVDRLMPVLSDAHIMRNEIIAVDEAQFFPDLKDFVVCAVETHLKTVLVAGLDGDFRRQKFGQLLDLIPHADVVTKLHGKCHFCNRTSLFSSRVVLDDRQELVGGEGLYLPTCRQHYMEMARARDQKADG